MENTNTETNEKVSAPDNARWNILKHLNDLNDSLESENKCLLAQRDELLAAAKLVAGEVECYCADYVAAKGPCPMHALEAAIANAERGAQ